jgi:hypothetical protein
MKQAEKLREATALESMGEVPSYRDVSLPPRFARDVMDRQQLTDQIHELEERKRVISERIFEDLAATGLRAVQVDGYRPAVVDSERSKIDPKLLLEQGVSAFVIQKATVVSHSTYLQVYDTAKGKVRGQEKREGVEPIRKNK